MSTLDANSWKALADAYAFLGNSLLRPMSQTADAGLDASFWSVFPDFESEDVAHAIDSLALWAESRRGEARDAVVTDVSVEYTALFVGPPSPLAPPWETMNRREGATVGFGEPTFQMREVLRGLGLEAAGPSNQYEDHLGLELLCLSEMCRRRAWALDMAATAREVAARGESVDGLSRELSGEEVAAYLDEHPLGWVGALEDKVEAARPDGYYVRLLTLARSLMERHKALLG
ncbi:molecular chaperone TorD family protein [Adlercreutzia sp. R25]|uniref:TorD/DmsD family molecular chaperone n=1 Tax=Adlercreutzia shanghongiae TaxID=3111773 RepID=UPI002DBCB30F|nr:molecular chaperone TorD family protein [Adlercreutzia sp. R25]MEC4272851.1 molecular chaperone TorD family protein [Adlercreutzia sp. R25]